MRVAVIGFGGIGKAFVELVNRKNSFLSKEGIDVRINYIIGRCGGVYVPDGIDLVDFLDFRQKGGELLDYQMTKGQLPFNEVTIDEMLKNNDVDVVVELTPTNKETGEPGLTHIRESLERGINVITANKGPVLLAYKELNSIAVDRGVQFCIGCTTGGALPSINGGILDMAGAEILSIEGVLNGTTNFIINEMETKGVNYHDALMVAQKLGIAEANPSLDVEGWDTAIKLLILTNVLLDENKTLADISVEGITKITPEDIKECKAVGKKYKLVGRMDIENNKIVMSVKPEKINSQSPFYIVDGKNKAVRYTSDVLGDLTIMGGASGVIPAAASVFRDLVNISRGYRYSR